MAASDGGVKALFGTSTAMLLVGAAVLVGWIPIGQPAGWILLALGMVLMLAAAQMRKNARLYSNTHFREFLEHLDRLQGNAGSSKEVVDTTILGVRTSYGVERRGNRFVHRIQLSLHGQPIPFGLGGTLACLGLRAMAVPRDRWVLAHTGPKVVHVGFVLTEQEHEATRERELRAAAPDALRAARQQAVRDMMEIRGDNKPEQDDSQPELFASQEQFEQALRC